jgi:hypothetical protein
MNLVLNNELVILSGARSAQSKDPLLAFAFVFAFAFLLSFPQGICFSPSPHHPL